MVLKKIKKSQLKRLKKWPWKLFFDKNIEKLRPNPDSLLMTVCKWRQILQDLKWFWNKVKIPKKEVERMGMKNLFFCQKHREIELKFRFFTTDLLQNWKKPRIMLYKVWYFSRAKKMLFTLKSGQNFRSGSPEVLENLKTWLEHG